MVAGQGRGVVDLLLCLDGGTSASADKISDMPGNPLTVPRKVRKGLSVLAASLCVFAEISPVA